ncbi:hypothetical protein AX17_001180 [Amanita inopinata Kibby_2008]|nr:hypothetical protein AX17_001180 [Amanita inopinata Kibby_2008]
MIQRIEKPLSNLITDVTLSPSLATTILDTDVGEPWLHAIDGFERRLVMIKSKARVKAARDLGEVAEGLRIAAATKLRAFFLALFQPIRSSVTTNMQVIQRSVLLKYSPLFAFLQRQAPDVAQEVQRSYIGAARVYYETGFRRYARSLGYIKKRTSEKFDTIVSTEPGTDLQIDLDRLACAKIDGPAISLSYMADDKAYKEPIEALLRSLFLVFMDNSTAEYTFVNAFFNNPQPYPPIDLKSSKTTATTPVSPDRESFAEDQSNVGSEFGEHLEVAGNTTAVSATFSPATPSKKEPGSIDTIWKQIMEPVLEYCRSFVNSILESPPSVTSLLTMIRLVEDVVIEIQRRHCPPVETYVFTTRLQMWPVFQKLMSEHIESLKKLAEGSTNSYFSRAPSTTESVVIGICNRYIVIFSSFVHLTVHEEETMIFSNLLRLRQELGKLILRHTNQIKDIVARSTKQSSIYEALLKDMSRGTELTAHPKLQQEIAYWSNLEEEARRKILSMDQSKSRGLDVMHVTLSHCLLFETLEALKVMSTAANSQTITIPPLTVEEEDQIIHVRITNDERPLRRIIKKFHNYTALSHKPIVPPIHSPGSGISIDDAREAFLVELASFQLLLKKSVMICEAEARQVEEYKRERQRIDDEHGTLRGQIEQLKTSLEHAQLLRRRKIEYDLVAEKVNTLPSRDELEQCIQALENDMIAIRQEHDHQNRTIQEQKSALDRIITDLGFLRFVGKERDVTVSVGTTPRETPAPESGNAEMADGSERATSVAPQIIVESGEKEESEADRGSEETGFVEPDETREDIEMGEVEEDPKDNNKNKKKLREELEEGEASDTSSALSDLPDD